MLTERLNAARQETTLALAELLLLADGGPCETKTVAGRLIARLEKVSREIDHADSLARGAAGMARRLGAETAGLLAPETPPVAGPHAPFGEQATPTASKNVKPCETVGHGPACNFASGVSAVLLTRLVKAVESIDGHAA